MFDIVLVADPRFSGGTSSAMATDARIFQNMGCRIGLIFVTSGYLNSSGQEANEDVLSLLDLPNIERIDPATTAKAKIAFLHHPMVFSTGIVERPKLEAGKLVMVTHHLPFRGDGSLQYDPISTSRQVRRLFGQNPLWAPVSGVCRSQLLSFAPLLKLTSQDWPNVFDHTAWTPTRKTFSESTIRIGRHGRDDLLKWPALCSEIQDSLPSGLSQSVHVMGCPKEDLTALGVDISDWNIVPFDGLPVAEFLDRLDIFIYHFHPNVMESFGRTVAEAMLMEAVCILDPRLEPTFGDLALYCPPKDTQKTINILLSDRTKAAETGARARQAMLRDYGVGSIPSRFSNLMRDGGTNRRTSEAYSGYLNTARKLIGMHRRGEATTHASANLV